MPRAPSGAHTLPFQRARPKPSRPLIRPKLPPANSSPLLVRCRAKTAVAADDSMPPPIADQAVPFQRATLRAGTPPATSNWPAATRPPANSASAKTTVCSCEDEFCMPPPSDCQLLPFHCATLSFVGAPARASVPPATTAPLLVASKERTRPTRPLPSGDHTLPFQRATELAATPSMALN